jgi:hypothetical protein
VHIGGCTVHSAFIGFYNTASIDRLAVPFVVLGADTIVALHSIHIYIVRSRERNKIYFDVFS